MSIGGSGGPLEPRSGNFPWSARLADDPHRDRGTALAYPPVSLGCPCCAATAAQSTEQIRSAVGSVIKKRRKRMAKKKHRKLLKKTRVQRRRQGK
jgi:hypothetical protein